MDDFYCRNCQSECLIENKEAPCQENDKCDKTGLKPNFLLPENSLVLEIYNYTVLISDYEKIEWTEGDGDKRKNYSKLVYSISKLPEVIKLFEHRISFSVEQLIDLIMIRHSIYRNNQYG